MPDATLCVRCQSELGDVRLHAGLVSIDAPFGLNLSLQRQIFGLILDDLVNQGDLTNQVLQVDIHKDGRVEFLRFPLPPDIDDSARDR